MPVSYVACVIPMLLLGLPFLFRLKGKKPFLFALGVSVAIAMVLVLRVYLAGWYLMAKASTGDPRVQFELARWHENHCEEVNRFFLWPCTPQVLTGYEWVEKAAKQGYPIAIYTQGVRLKHGHHVPRPADWKGPEGNYFPQPERGRPLIDKALSLGYEPDGEEEHFYFATYRRP